MAEYYKNKYSIRRDALISPWGVGAIVPFPHDESLMVAGLDFWFDKEHNYEDFIISDDRLTKRLGGKIFVCPPDFRDNMQDSKHANMKISAVRFPHWHYCPVCGNMEEVGSAGEKKNCPGDIRKHNGEETYCSKQKAKKKKTPMMVPERFIAVCEDGHIEDFPIKEWVHIKSNKPIQPNCKLVRSTGGISSSLAGIRYTCTCGASATMNGAFGRGALDKIGYKCQGKTPWLGDEKQSPCGKSLLVLQRGASNVWFADIISSVYIPNMPKYKNEDTKECIARGAAKFASYRTDSEIDEQTIRAYVMKNQEWSEKIDIEQAIEEIIATLKNHESEDNPQTEDDYRKQEFDVLTSSTGKPDDELYCRNYRAESYENLNFLKGISLVYKLRETRVFNGFRRIFPDAKVKPPISIKELPWLPAVENRGEGIMFEFDRNLLEKWAERQSVIERVKIIESNLAKSGNPAKGALNPIFILLHTFAHCLINTLAGESGYSNASIRERIYCSKYIDTNAPQMAGIMIYTASGDSEGSLGGLVRQGIPGRIEKIINHAIDEARWCAADPVCIQSNGQGQNGCNLAACHNCALLPETSCENKNALLDRGLMIGTLDEAGIGFFNYGND